MTAAPGTGPPRSSPAIALDPRTPRPDPRFDLYGATAATVVAAIAYLLALSVQTLPPREFSVALFGAAPALAGIALVVLHMRSRDVADEPLRWVSAGLTVSFVAMLLQFISFPAVAAGGGIFGTSGQGSAALYLTFHVALPLGALLGVVGAPAAARVPVVVTGVVLALLFAVNAIPLPDLLTPAQSFTGLQRTLDYVTVGLTVACTALWVLRAGRAARSLAGWVGVALSFSTYDVLFNGLAARRYNAVWWSSLSMRVTTYAVLSIGMLVTVLRELTAWQRYSDSELDRREAQLRESLARTEQLLATATDAATTLQRQLLPHAVITAPGVELAAQYRSAGAAEQVGGDWYDTIELPSGGLALVIGDVQGHDLAAASLMGLVRASVRSYALEGHPPSLVLSSVNTFVESIGTERLVTMAYLELYPDDRVVTVTLAGHPPPVVVSDDGSVAFAVGAAPGPALGVEPVARWGEQTLLLPPSASLVLHTDGLVETPSEDLDAVERVRRVVQQLDSPKPDTLADALIATAPPYDDVAVLVAHVTAAHRPAAQRSLPAQPVSAALARVWLADMFDVWEGSGVLDAATVRADQREVAQLLLTELVSNGVRHSDAAIGVSVQVSGTTLRVEVVDTSHRMPALRHPGTGDTAGRGLLLVDTMAARWGVELREVGKAVWFEVDLSSPRDIDEAALLAGFDDD